jgi:hypothetical protein
VVAGLILYSQLLPQPAAVVAVVAMLVILHETVAQAVAVVSPVI